MDENEDSKAEVPAETPAGRSKLPHSSFCEVTDGFVGNYEAMVTRKRTVLLPAAFMRTIQKSGVVTPAVTIAALTFSGPRIIIMSEQGWQELQESLASIEELAEDDSRLRGMRGVIERSHLQGGRRLRLSARLLTAAGLEPGCRVVLVGAATQIEIWAEQEWQDVCRPKHL